MESVHDVSATSPELCEWFANCGSSHSPLFLDLARLVRVFREAHTGTAIPVLSGAQPAQVLFAANARLLAIASSLSQVGADASSWIELFII